MRFSSRVLRVLALLAALLPCSLNLPSLLLRTTRPILPRSLLPMKALLRLQKLPSRRPRLKNLHLSMVPLSRGC